MKNTVRLFLSALVVLVAVALATAVRAEGHAYVGAEKCKMCHNTPAKGAQYTKWMESKHAKAFANLAGEEAKKVAQAKGIADPQKDPSCLKCHVTGGGTDPKVKMEEGVGCEACHGAGGDYWQMAVMKDHAKAVAAGLVEVTEATCKNCHNEGSPTFKGFDFAAMSAKIAHPNPQKGAAK